MATRLLKNMRQGRQSNKWLGESGIGVASRPAA
jgi:hypothetical protein